MISITDNMYSFRAVVRCDDGCVFSAVVYYEADEILRKGAYFNLLRWAKSIERKHGGKIEK